MSLAQLRQYFFAYCHGCSVMYEVLASADGARFRQECRDAGKSICSWTVNGKEEMRQCARWNLNAIITDKPEQWREIKKEVSNGCVSVCEQSLTSDHQGPSRCLEAHAGVLCAAFPPDEELQLLIRESVSTISV